MWRRRESDMCVMSTSQHDTECTLPRSRVEREERGSSAGIQSMMSSTFQSIMRCNRNEKEKEKTQLNGVSLNRIQSEVTAC